MLEEVKICPKCKIYTLGHYCSHCGTRELKDIPTCPCGERLMRNDNYCSNCGSKVPPKLYYGRPCKAKAV